LIMNTINGNRSINQNRQHFLWSHIPESQFPSFIWQYKQRRVWMSRTCRLQTENQPGLFLGIWNWGGCRQIIYIKKHYKTEKIKSWVGGCRPWTWGAGSLPPFGGGVGVTISLEVGTNAHTVEYRNYSHL